MKEARAKYHNTKLFDMDRTRAYQILRELDSDVWLHWLRHQRLSHLGEFLDVYQLAKKVGFWTRLESSLAYVHSREQPYYKALAKVRKTF